jgi:hypothetical protein
MHRTEWLLQNYVFRVPGVELESYRPWIGFVLRVANDGAPSETQTRLRAALMTIATRGQRRGAGGRATRPEASRQFQLYMREQISPTGSGELSHLDRAAREEFLNREVLQRFASHLPRLEVLLDENGNLCLSSEPTPDVGSEPPMKVATEPGDLRRFEGEWLSQLAKANEAKCLAVIAALSADPDASKLMRCAHCQQFFWSRTAHRRTHNFCREEHRRAYDLAHRDPKVMARKMREWRSNLMTKKGVARLRRRCRSRSQR